MIKSKKPIQFDASRPKEKAIVVLAYGNQMAMVKDKIELSINHYKVNDQGQMQQISTNHPTIVMDLKEFNEITKKYDLNIENGWVDALLNAETVTKMMLDQVGSNSELFYGLKEKDWEPLNN